MDEESGRGGLWPRLSRFFTAKKCDAPIERTILEARKEGDLKPDEGAMLLNVLRLGRRQVQEIIIPRTDITCAESGSTITDIAQIIMDSGHSRIPIYRDNRDNIIGIVHAKDLLKSVMAPDRKEERLEDLMRTPFFIPETKNVKDLLQEFRSRKIHLAIALDEYGGTSGLVTFEDVLEEIVGEIEDEYDQPREQDIRVINDKEVLVSGRTPLEELETRFGLRLESEQVETLGGYLCEIAGRVPSEGESFFVEGCRFSIEEADAKHIKSIKFSPPEGGADLVPAE